MFFYFKEFLKMNIFFNFRNLKSISNRFYSINANSLSKTCLYDFHIRHGAKMVEFAGYSMPLQYKTHSIMDSHNWVRTKCGLFDVSHMLQFRIHGVKREEFIHCLTVADMSSLPVDQGTLSLFTNADGGIMDDFIINNCSQFHYYVVSNAGCADKIRKHLICWQDKFQMQGKDVRVDWVNNGLIALQGPLMSEILQPGLEFPLKSLHFGQGIYCTVFGIKNCRITRCGYTGEDGVEICVPNEYGEYLAEKLLSNESVIPIGLGARDTLRLEAGMCLYGNDINEMTTPSEAQLSWTIGKKRRNVQLNETKFSGYERIMNQLNNKETIMKRRVGMIASEGPPPRKGSEILNEEGDHIGEVTSGCFSPYLTLNICMGYVKSQYAKPKTELKFKVRGKTYPGYVTKMPFIKTNYHTGS